MKAKASKDTHKRRVGVVIVLSIAAVAACAAAVVLTVSGNHSRNPVLEAEIRAVIIALPIAVGLYMWNRDPWTRFAKLLVFAGFAWSLTTLAQSSNDVLYSAGRVFGWSVEPFLIFLVLAFPSGRLTTRTERVLVAGSLALVALLYLPTMLLVESYPTPSPWTSCNGDCPGNALMVLGSEPGFVGSLVVPIREVTTVLLFAGVVALLAARIRRGTPLMRITLVPVLAVAIVHALAFIGGFVARRAVPGATAEVLSWAIALSFAGVAAGFMVGLWLWRLFENRALRRLAAGLADNRPALTLAERRTRRSRGRPGGPRAPSRESAVWMSGMWASTLNEHRDVEAGVVEGQGGGAGLAPRRARARCAFASMPGDRSTPLARSCRSAAKRSRSRPVPQPTSRTSRPRRTGATKATSRSSMRS